MRGWVQLKKVFQVNAGGLVISASLSAYAGWRVENLREDLPGLSDFGLPLHTGLPD